MTFLLIFNAKINYLSSYLLITPIISITTLHLIREITANYFHNSILIIFSSSQEKHFLPKKYT